MRSRPTETPFAQVERLRERRAERLARKAEERQSTTTLEEATAAKIQNRVFEIRVN
ncbi:hypothetical protein ACFL3T_01570 [Patescibacteria group bacterium]